MLRERRGVVHLGWRVASGPAAGPGAPGLASGRRSYTGWLGRFAIKSREHATPTAMEPEIAFLMASLGRVGASSRVLDPTCGSGGLLLSWQPVRRIRPAAHATRDPQARWRCDKRLPSRELDQNKRSGSHVVVSGHYHSTHLDCRRADQDDAASAADCLQILIGRSSRVLCDP